MKIPLFRHGALTQLSLLLLLFLSGCVRRSLGDDCKSSIGGVDFAYVAECNDNNYDKMCNGTPKKGEKKYSCLCNPLGLADGDPLGLPEGDPLGLPDGDPEGDPLGEPDKTYTYYVCTSNCDESTKSKKVDGQCVQ